MKNEFDKKKILIISSQQNSQQRLFEGIVKQVWKGRTCKSL